MKEGLTSDRIPASYSGATVPELHRLLLFISKTNLTLCPRTMGVKTWYH